jgi:hypothetical protein
LGRADAAQAVRNADAAALAALYERVPLEDVHGWRVDLVPDRPGRVLNFDAGSGRGAA